MGCQLCTPAQLGDYESQSLSLPPHALASFSLLFHHEMLPTKNKLKKLVGSIFEGTLFEQVMGSPAKTLVCEVRAEEVQGFWPNVFLFLFFYFSR